MPMLLHIDSSPLYGQSVSRQLTGAFVAQWETSHPDGTVVDRDLNATPIQPVTGEWVGCSLHTGSGTHTAAEGTAGAFRHIAR